MSLMEKFPPKAAKTAIIATMMAALPFAFNNQAAAQSNDNSLFASNAASITNVVNSGEEKAKPATPVIIRSGSWDASWYSKKNNALVVYISTGSMEQKYTAEQYANMLGKMFKDPARTNHPTDVVFFIEETDKNGNVPVGETMTITYINGFPFDPNGGKLVDGDDILHPYAIPGYISVITKQYAEANSAPTVTGQSYGLNH